MNEADILALFKKCGHKYDEWQSPPGPAIYGPGGKAIKVRVVCKRPVGDAKANGCHIVGCPQVLAVAPDAPESAPLWHESEEDED